MMNIVSSHSGGDIAVVAVVAQQHRRCRYIQNKA